MWNLCLFGLWVWQDTAQESGHLKESKVIFFDRQVTKSLASEDLAKHIYHDIVQLLNKILVNVFYLQRVRHVFLHLKGLHEASKDWYHWWGFYVDQYTDWWHTSQIMKNIVWWKIGGTPAKESLMFYLLIRSRKKISSFKKEKTTHRIQ